MTYRVALTDDFEAWLAAVRDPIAARAIKTRLVRFEAGLFGDVKSLGDGVSEARVDVGQGYRLYYTIRGREMVVLLCGGDKRRQRADIEKARALATGLAG